MKTLNFFNRKGGVGKTVIAANIASELARKGYRVLIIDLDSQCDLTELFLNLNPSGKVGSKKRLNVHNVLENECSIEKAYEKVGENLYLLPGSPSIESFTLKFSQKALRDKLRSKGLSRFNYVIIDNPPSITPAVVCGLVASDYVVVVTEAENPAINNLTKLNTQIEELRKKLNPSLSILGIALNKIDQRRNITKRNVKKLQQLFPDILFENLISIDTSVPNSIDHRIPIRDLHWRSRTVSQLQRLLDEMLHRIDSKEGANGQSR